MCCVKIMYAVYAVERELFYMNMTKRDVQELRRRLKKKDDCTFGMVCGCYVNSGKQTVTKFEKPFSELEEDESFKYLEIAQKSISGGLAANLLELEFDMGDKAEELKNYLLELKGSKLEDSELLDKFYERVIAEYSNPGNYLILLYHDIYDVPVRARDGAGLDESEEVYEYIICALCPVELSKPTLGYCEDENRIGACERDWIVSLPELGFVYPAFIDHGSDVNAVMYYVKTGKSSHPEFVENVLGCIPQRTAAEDKQVFQDIVTGAFGEDDDMAETAFMLLQNTIGGIVAELKEDETLPLVNLTSEVVTDLAAESDIPEEVRERIEQSCAEVFGDAPPAVTTVFDAKLAEKGAQRANTIRLERKIEDLSQQIAEMEGADGSEEKPEADAEEALEASEKDSTQERPSGDSGTPLWEDNGGIVLHMPEDKASRVRTEAIDGQRYLLIPLDEDEAASINGENRQL